MTNPRGQCANPSARREYTTAVQNTCPNHPSNVGSGLFSAGSVFQRAASLRGICSANLSQGPQFVLPAAGRIMSDFPLPGRR